MIMAFNHNIQGAWFSLILLFHHIGDQLVPKILACYLTEQILFDFDYNLPFIYKITTEYSKIVQIPLFCQFAFILFCIIYTNIVMNDHIIDNRLNRSLAIHDLDNLVYQKRQRKSVEPQALPFIQKPLIKKTSSKKKQQSPVVVSTKKSPSKNKRKEVVVNKKTIKIKKTQQKKAQKVKQQSQSEEINEESVDMESSSSQKMKIKEVQKQRKARNIIPKITKKVDKNIKQQQSQSQSENIDINMQNTIKNQEQLVKNQVSQVNKKQSPIKQIKQQNPLEEGYQHHTQSQKKRRGRPRKVIPAPPNQIIQEQQKPEAQKNAVSCPEIKYQDLPNEVEQVVPQNNQTGKTRARKAKQKPVVRYNENEDDVYSDQSFQTDKDQRKKKRISKANRSKNKKEPYSLNRIFRKEAKKSFPAYQLNVNLGKLSFKEFVDQFGVFDMVHFSLPVQYLQLFPDMPILMEKGFVFIWVQRKETQIGYHLLNRWGYDVIDQIVWIKCNEDQGKIQSQGIQLWRQINKDQQNEKSQLFINTKTTCLVGYKCPPSNKAEYRTKVSNNIIFAKPQGGIKKPEEIYEIADLMMPGAKKLEIGGSSQKGWLNLKHNQATMYRCHSCLKEQNLYLLRQASNKKVLCKKCLVQSLYTENDQENEIQALQAKFNKLGKNKIKELLYSENLFISCSRCVRSYHEVAYEGFLRQQGSEQFLCLDCYQLKLNSDNNKDLQVLLLKKNYYNEAPIQCFSCNDTTMYDIYFQCSKCKNHKICKKCFWATAQPKVALQDEEVKKSSRQIHQWKLKLIKKNPVMKFWCYECKKEMNLPFYCCETCQSWMWCGKCSRGTNEIHPHYQTDKHNEYLLI